MLAIIAAIIFALGLLPDLLNVAVPGIGGTAFVLLGLCLLALHQAGASRFIPGWPYSVVAVLEMGRSSWMAPLDVMRLGPADDATATPYERSPSG